MWRHISVYPLPPSCHGLSQKDNPLPLSERDVIYEWPLKWVLLLLFILGLHQREVFLFNDLLVITKIHSRKKNTVTYTFRQSYLLAGMVVTVFETQFYPHGIQVMRFAQLGIIQKWKWRHLNFDFFLHP